jgi:sterol desaturase/sphingolipid hydroxylase (fatty acid hydroxylase superfamily)
MSLPEDTTSLVRYRAAASTLWLLLLLVWESLAPAIHAFRSRGDRGRHALRNLLLGGINAALTGLVFVALWSWTSAWAAGNGIGLLHVVSLPPPLRWCAAILLFDLWTYLWHRAGHRLPHLWGFHRVHHSDASMDVTTANRFHAVEILISSVLRIPLIALLGLHMPEVVLYETLLQFVVQFQHANIRLPAPMEALLRLVVVTPGLHRVHHSRWQPETDSNFSSLLTVWDRLFGTFRVREDETGLRLGLDGFDDERQQRFAGLWRMPFLRPGPPTSDEAARSRAPGPPSG